MHYKSSNIEKTGLKKNGLWNKILKHIWKSRWRRKKATFIGDPIILESIHPDNNKW